MNKNIFIILMIFLVPLVAYFGLTRDNMITQPTVAADGAQVIKFSSPMCYECQQLEKVFEQVYPTYQKDIALVKVDVTKKDTQTKNMIKKYNIKLVPTTIFKESNGNIKYQIEGTMETSVLDNYFRELINE